MDILFYSESKFVSGMATWVKCTEDEEIVHLVDSNLMFINLDQVRMISERPGGGSILYFGDMPDDAAVNIIESPAEIWALAKIPKL